MFALVYVSRATLPFDAASLRELAERAAAKNERLAVTGYLCFQAGRFLQVLEGEAATVRALMDEIALDPRHAVARRLDLGEQQQRFFPGWHMRRVTGAALHEIHLESVLEVVLAEMTGEIYGEERARQLVLGMVRKLAQFRAQPGFVRALEQD